MWKLDQVAIRLPTRSQDRVWTKRFENRDFIAALKFRTAKAVFPDLEGKLAPLDLAKAQLSKEIRHIGESEYRMQAVFDGLLFEPQHDLAAYSSAIPGGIDGERADFTRGRSVEVQRAATQ